MSAGYLERERRALAALMRSPALATGDVTAAVQQATEAAAQLLAVRRASVWRFDDQRQRIECLDLFDAEAGTHAAGAFLHAADAPAYFAAVSHERAIVAHDARTDPRTRELTATYLKPLGVASMLDVPVLVHGRLVGVLCHEHVGAPRPWAPEEELVAGTLADFVGMALGSAAHLAQARQLATLQRELERRVDTQARELRSSQATVRQLFETSPIALIVTRLAEDTVLLGNQRAAEMFEVPLEHAYGQRPPDFWVDLDDRARLLARLRETGNHEGFEAELRTASGKKFWALVSAAVIEFEGSPAVVVGAQDISAQKGTEATLRTLLDAAPIPLVVTGLDDAVVRFSNTRAADMFKTTMDELVGKRAPDFYANPEERTAFIEALRGVGRVDGFAARLRAADGATFWSLLSARTLDLHGAPAFMVGFADLTEQKEIERQLRELAELDGLTGTFNRRHFFASAGPALARARLRGRPMCVAMIDADHFKDVNDRHGHAIGDEALRRMAQVCRSASRTSDILARYGGEELVLLLADADLDAARLVTERIRAGLAAAPLELPGGGSLTVRVSIGLAQHREGETIDDMLRRADGALYEAKRAGRDRVVAA